MSPEKSMQTWLRIQSAKRVSRHDEPCVFILEGRARLLNVYRLLKLNLFLLVETVGVAASVEFLDEAQVGKVLGLGRFCLGIFFR